MQNQFSEKLIQRLIGYLHKRCDLVVTPDEAQEYLLSLSELYLAFSGEAHLRPPQNAIDGALMSDLIISTHTEKPCPEEPKQR